MFFVQFAIPLRACDKKPPEVSRCCVPVPLKRHNFPSNLAVPMSVVFWIILSLIFTPIFSLYPVNRCDTVPNAPITTDNTITL